MPFLLYLSNPDGGFSGRKKEIKNQKKKNSNDILELAEDTELALQR